MFSTPWPEYIAQLMDQPNPAVMATVAADGRPVTVGTWYLMEPDGRMLLGLDAGRVRLKHLRRDPRVSLTALLADQGYAHISVQGRVVSIVDDEGLRDIDRISQHFKGEPYPDRERPRVSVHVELDRWHAWSVSAP